jgi:hypothetical protein
MNKLLKSHVGYYLSLGTLLVICFGLIVIVGNQPAIKITILIMTAVLYAIWGVAHHAVHHDISARVVIEYILIAALGMVLVLLVVR